MCDSRFKLDDVSIQTPHLYQSEHHRRHRAVIKPSSNSYKFTVAANYTVNMMPSIGAATIRKLSPPNVKDVYLVTLPEQQSISQTVDHTSSGFRECRFVPTGDKSIRIGSKSVHWGKISGKVELDLEKLGRLREYFLLNRGIAQGEWRAFEASEKAEKSLSKIVARKQDGTLVRYPDLTALFCINDALNELVIAFPGMSSLEDTVRCAEILAGLVPKQLSQADELMQHMEDALKNGQPRYHLKLVGHSMGGAIAAYAGAKHHVPFEVFNPLGLGSGILSTLKKEDIRVAKEQSACYIDEGDWVSDPRHPKGGLRLFSAGIRFLGGGLHLGKFHLIPNEYHPQDEGLDLHNRLDLVFDQMIGRLAHDPQILENIFKFPKKEPAVKDSSDTVSLCSDKEGECLPWVNILEYRPGHTESAQKGDRSNDRPIHLKDTKPIRNDPPLIMPLSNPFVAGYAVYEDFNLVFPDLKGMSLEEALLMIAEAAKTITNVDMRLYNVDVNVYDIDGTALPKNPFNLSRTVLEQYPPAGAVQPVFVLWKSIGCNGASLWIK